jgi:phage terminase large subunit-like protein
VSTLEKPLIGCTEPRIGTPASGDDRRVREILAFAEDIGVQLLPWQSALFDRGLRMTGDKWTHRTVLAITSRQSGKTKCASVRALAELCLWDARLVCMAGQNRDVTLHSWRACCELAESSGMDIKAIRRATGSEELVLDMGGHTASLKVVSSTADGARGLSPRLVIADEIASWKSLEPWGAIEKSRRAQHGSQVWATTSEGTHESVVLDVLQEQGRAAALAGSAAGIGYYEWSADPSLAPDDRRGWAMANPALGYLITEDVIAQEYATDPPEIFARETLCWRTSVTQSWIPTSTWDSCADVTATVPDSAVGEVVFALDLTPDLQHGAVAVAWPRTEQASGRSAGSSAAAIHVEAVSAFSGQSASVDAQRRLEGLLERWRPRALVVVAKGPAEAVGARVAAGAGVDLVAVNGADLDRASRSFLEAVVSRRLVHPHDVVLAGAVAAVEGDGGLIRLGRRTSPADITPAVASILACWVADKAPAPAAPSWVAW